MKRPDIYRDVDLSNSTAKRELMVELGRFGGLYAVSVKPVRLTRTSQQNRYFHGVVTRSFREYMADQGQHFTHDQCYQYLRDKFIERPPILNIETGEVMDYMPASTAALNIDQFVTFLDDVIFWLEDSLNIIVPAPDQLEQRRTQQAPQHTGNSPKPKLTRLNPTR